MKETKIKQDMGYAGQIQTLNMATSIPHGQRLGLNLAVFLRTFPPLPFPSLPFPTLPPLPLPLVVPSLHSLPLFPPPTLSHLSTPLRPITQTLRGTPTPLPSTPNQCVSRQPTNPRLILNPILPKYTTIAVVLAKYQSIRCRLEGLHVPAIYGVLLRNAALVPVGVSGVEGGGFGGEGYAGEYAEGVDAREGAGGEVVPAGAGEAVDCVGEEGEEVGGC